jgi:hypothetical protein
MIQRKVNRRGKDYQERQRERGRKIRVGWRAVSRERR